ncbi:MAG: glycosyltransferase family 2 protein [Patescibacteria group bacterium]
MQKLPELSVFFPFWNEQDNIKKTVSDALRILPEVAERWEAVLVDDGSTDKTLEIAERLAQQDQRIRVVSHRPNRGYGAALKEGLTHAEYSYVAFTDGDGQFDLSEISKLIEVIPAADIVIGYRKKRRDTLSRHVLMNLLKVWDWVFFGFWFRDIDCGFKLFTRHALQEIGPLRSEGAMITTEILAKAVYKKLKIREVEVTHYPRKFGAQSGANVSVILRAVFESLILWWDIRNKQF